MAQTKKTGLAFVLLSTLMFGSYGVWSRLLGGSFDPFFQGWTRGLILALILLPIVVATKSFVPIQKQDWKWLSIFLIATSLTQAPIYYAFNHMDIGTATLLFFVGMILTMYSVGFFFLGEKLSLIKATSFIIACAGLYLVFSFSAIVFTLLAASMALFNGVATGNELAFSKKLSGNYSTLYLTWLSWVTIFVVNGLISWIIGERQIPLAFNMAWLYQLGYSLVSLVGFWAVVQGLKSVEASIGGLIGLLEIVFSVILGSFIFHEGLTPKTALGGLLIIGAAALPHIVELRYRLRSGVAT